MAYYRRSRDYYRYRARARARRAVLNREPRFTDFVEMTSRFDSVGCVNDEKHAIKRGETIGWSRGHRLACCADCWARWKAENAEATEAERRAAAEAAASAQAAAEVEAAFMPTVG